MPKNYNFFLFVAVVYTLVLLYFTLGNPHDVLPEERLAFQDKIFHFLAYIVFALVWGIFVLKANYKRGILLSFVATLAFGIVLEIIQERVNPLREYDNIDMLANCVGVVVGMIIVLFYKNLKLK